MSKRKKQKKVITENIDEQNLEDLIGREDIVAQFLKLIEMSDKNRNWCFALDGEWGCGKSFLLNMLDEATKRNSEYVVIRYNAWKNDFYPDPLIAILYNILDSEKLLSNYDGVVQGIKNSINFFSSLLSLIPGYDDFKEKAEKSLKSLFKKHSKTESLNIQNEFVGYNQALEVLKFELKEVTKDKKLIVLVDEVDRCSPDYAMSILNRLHNVFDVPGVYVVVALNKNVLEKMIETQFGIKDKNYLDKFFDLTIKLPNTGRSNSRETLGKRFLYSLFVENEINKIQEELFLSLILELGTNTRTIKKNLEKINYIIKNANPEKITFQFVLLILFLWIKRNSSYGPYASNFISQKPLKENTNYILKRIDGLNEPFTKNFGSLLHNNVTIQHIFAGTIELYTSDHVVINEFLALLNLIRYLNDSTAYIELNKWYKTELTEDDYNEVKKIYDLVKLLALGETI